MFLGESKQRREECWTNDDDGLTGEPLRTCFISRLFPGNLNLKCRIISGPVTFLLMAGLLCQCSWHELKTPEVGKEAPDFSLPSLNEEKVTLKGLEHNGIVLVNFWATWCAACKEEVPLLNQIYQKYKGKGLTVVGISVEERKDMVAAFCRKSNVQYPVLLDLDGEVTREFAVIGIPTTFVLNRQGTVLLQRSQSIDEQWATTLEKILGGAAN